MITYKAAVLTAPRKIVLTDQRLRRLKSSEVLIRVHYAGICGTDLALYSGNYRVPLPLVLGHEFVGVVKQVGNSEFSALVGKNATAEINNTCRSYRSARPCPACRRALDHHCLRRTVTGIIGHDGAFADYIVVPALNVLAIPPTISLEEAVFIEPLAAALQTFRLTPITGDESIVVLGAGRLGLLVGIVAHAKHAQVLMITRSEAKKKLARRYGLHCISGNNTKDIVRRAKTRTGQLGADIVVEATGSPDMISAALQLVRPRGTLALKSTPGTPARLFDVTRTVVNEVQIQGSRCGDFPEAISFLSTSKIDLSDLIQGVFPLQELRAALHSARTRSKILLRCSGSD